MTDEGAAVGVLSGDVCTESEFQARLKMCGLSFLRRQSERYLIYQDRNGQPALVRDPKTMSLAERADAIVEYETIYPPSGCC
jgi:hypothetical protein